MFNAGLDHIPVKRITTFILLTGIFLVLHSGQVPVFEPWVEHRNQPAPQNHEHPMVDQDLRGTSLASIAKLTPSQSLPTPVKDAGVPQVKKVGKVKMEATQKPIAKVDATSSPNATTESKPAPLSPEEKLERRKEYYRELAGSTGKFHDAIGKKLPEVIPDILDQEIPAHSDVVILLDHTSSMGEDIESMRSMMNDIKSKLQQKPGIRIGAVTFSDLKYRPQIGYRYLPFGRSLEDLDKFLYDTPLIGSIEDMYGAIAKTIQIFKWRSGAKRTLIVISDEDPAEPSDSASSPAEVERLRQSTHPETILHTILLSKD